MIIFSPNSLVDNCTDGRVWTDIPCERTCRNPNPDCSDAVNVEPACACPHDEYWDGQRCVADRNECTCVHDGVLYHDGQVSKHAQVTFMNWVSSIILQIIDMKL